MGTQSFELGEFYAAYRKWLENGAPDGRPFFRGYGLCRALDTFTELLEPPFYTELYHSLSTEMKEQFINADLDMTHPFESAYLYYLRASRNKLHTNPMRIAWVKERANP